MTGRGTAARSALALVIVLGFQASTAWCQTPSEKAAAEALFQEAVDLMGQDKLADACAKYQASHDLDPAIGTLLRLADCYDRVGRSASAWALFVEAETVATRAQQTDRAEMAGTRASELKARLSTVRLQIENPGAVPGLEIAIDKADIPEPSWGTALPFDPGTVQIEVSAPGYETWTSEVEVPVGPAETNVRIPVLERTPEQHAAVPVALTNGAEPAAARGASEPTSSQATWGYVAGGVGLASLAAAGVLGYRAYALNQDSLASCAADDPNACTTEGKEMRDDAAQYGTYATIASGIGGGFLITGLVLVLTAPSSPSKETATPRLRVLADAGPRGGALTLRGAF
ncbi:MAG TPA: hypothetical protein VFU02_18930 [Polyangiaceae bacterium]|nr:hypothetical protein [Polyangiaceae bacterium]